MDTEMVEYGGRDCCTRSGCMVVGEHVHEYQLTALAEAALDAAIRRKQRVRRAERSVAVSRSVYGGQVAHGAMA